MQSDGTGSPQNNRTCVLSFDIDGTMEMGDPPGPITVDIVRRAREMGYVVGSCSDRPVAVQEMLWATRGMVMDFTVMKHQLAVVKARFEAQTYYHIGDTELDQQLAGQAGFGFFWPAAATAEPWTLDGASGGTLG